MNKTKFNTTADQTTCRSFQNYSVNLLILQMCIIFTLLAIVISNVALLRKLFKKKQKTRADKIFIILSCSDIGVGLFSIPMMYLELFLCDFIVNTMFYFNLLRHFSAHFPHSFSETLIIIIALDRVFIITKAQVYKKYITMKVLYQIIAFALILNLAVMTFSIMEKTLEPDSHVVFYILISVEICFLFITIIAYVYLFHFLQSKSKKIADKKHSGNNFNKKVMMTITYILICLFIFILVHFVGIAISFFIPTRDQRVLKNMIYWTNTLAYSNSYANAFLILYRFNKKK